MGNKKKAIKYSPGFQLWFDNLPKEQRIQYAGIAGKKKPDDDVPGFVITEQEGPMLEGSLSNGNAFIVLGTDRVNTPISGFGGIGHTHCYAIDIVAGRLGAGAFKKIDFDGTPGNPSPNGGELVYADPSFKLDAARIYISQKSIVDTNFGLAAGKGCVDASDFSPAQSCVAIKADGVRVIGRQGIKLITGGDTYNSQDGKIEGTYSGIDLIANNFWTPTATDGGDENSLQPLVKGNNLEVALLDLYDNVISLRKLIYNFLVTQRDLNRTLMTHVHIGPFMASPTSPSPPVIAAAVDNMIKSVADVEVGIIGNIMGVESRRKDYCLPGGAFYINSRWNNTN